jgi:hypothetical protein
VVEKMQKLEKEIPMLLCKMEKNIPPEFFNSMQHLLIHLPYEAKVGGHVQYRWMYHIEDPSDILNKRLATRQGLKGALPKHLFLRR